MKIIEIRTQEELDALPKAHLHLVGNGFMMTSNL